MRDMLNCSLYNISDFSSMLLFIAYILVFTSNANSLLVQTRDLHTNFHKLNCKNIKCPPIEDPVCVRIKNMNEKNKKITYIVAINKCEIQYAKCRQGVDAVKVPMEYCLHENGRKIPSSKRMKREVTATMPSLALFVAKNYTDDRGHHYVEYKSNGLYHEKDDKFTLDEPETQETPEIENADEKISVTEDVNQLGADYDQIAKDVDYTQYDKDCPTVCPARRVMVCAKCQHDIYRTFLSPCHLRVFNCKYPDEKLELMTRQPCMQSAPFLTNFPEAQGVVTEPGDEDDVLKFIHCRQKGRLDDDPRCKFNEK